MYFFALDKQRNKDQSPVCNHVLSSKKKRSNWVLKFNCAKSKSSKNTDIIPGQGNSNSDCVCTGYRRTEEHPMGAGIVFNSRSAPQSPVLGPLPPSPVIDLSRFNPEEFPMEVRFFISHFHYESWIKRLFHCINIPFFSFVFEGLRRTCADATRSRDGGGCRASTWL